MPDDSRPLAPSYNAALGILMQRAFGSLQPVPTDCVPGGGIPDRIQAWARRKMQGSPTGGDQPQKAETVGPDEPLTYWDQALPHRFLITGPLVDMAGAAVPDADRELVEDRLLDVYYKQYQALPLPGDLLDLLTGHEDLRPQDNLAEWLERARMLIMPAPSPGEARRRRLRLRAEAVRLCARERWSDEGAGLAELLVDVITLCHAAKVDLERALPLMGEHEGSISRAMKALSDDGETDVERLFPHLLRCELTLDDFPYPERARVREVVRTRKVFAWELWFRGGEAGAAALPAPETRSETMSRSPVEIRAKAEPAPGRPSDAAGTYRSLLQGLEKEIIGRPDLNRLLALTGVAHLMGVTHQRVLLCGTTGSGKSHSARALAEVLERPCMQIDMPDASATGWKGLDFPDILDALASRAGGSLEGAVLVLNEVDKVRINPKTDGNSLQAMVQLQGSLLALIDGALVTPEMAGGKQLETSKLLVVGTGAFGGRFVSDPPTTGELVKWGWIPEFAARWGQRICLTPPTRAEALTLLQNSERSVGRRLGPLTTTLGINIEVPRPVLGYVVDMWFRSGADYRSAAEWILTAARTRLITALETGEQGPITLAPDDIESARRSSSHDEESP